MSRPEKQHTVPKVLLRGFADSTSRLLVRRRGGTMSRVSLRRASVVPNFYSYPDEAGGWVDDIEHWLGRDIESPVGAVLIRARRGNGVSPSSSGVLARFAAAGLLRTATTRSYIDQVGQHLGPVLVMHEQLVRGQIDPATLSEAEWASAEDVAKAVWDRLGTPADPERVNLRLFLRLFDRLSTRLTAWTWSVTTAQKPCLVTADAPVAVLSSSSGGWSGILPAYSPVFIPISSSQLIVGEPRPPLAETPELSVELADIVNARLVFEAHDAVFADPRSGWPQLPALAPSRPTLPTPTVTFSRSKGNNGVETTEPSYPMIDDAAVRELLAALGGSEEVG